MYARTHYVSGTNNTECAVCGFQYKASQLRKRYDGLWVCQADWEPKPPQEMKERKHKGAEPAEHVLKSSTQGMLDAYDPDDHEINASSIPAYND